MRRLDTGALVKDYEGPDKEMTVAYQMAVSDVTFEDERYVVGPFLFLVLSEMELMNRNNPLLLSMKNSQMAKK